VPIGYIVEDQIFDINDINIDTTTSTPATSDDILKGKVAFANNEKIIGVIETVKPYVNID
jgi:hypothetical protein